MRSQEKVYKSDFFMFCKTVFPDIPDQAIAKMVAGVEVEAVAMNVSEGWQLATTVFPHRCHLR